MPQRGSPSKYHAKWHRHAPAVFGCVSKVFICRVEGEGISVKCLKKLLTPYLNYFRY
jgi:hypothetical protein